MAKFTVEKSIQQSSETVYQKLKEVLGNDTEFKKFDPKISANFNDANKAAAIKGSQFKAEVTVKHQGEGSLVQVTVDLPLLLMAFKGKIQSTLEKKLEQLIG